MPELPSTVGGLVIGVVVAEFCVVVLLPVSGVATGGGGFCGGAAAATV